MNNDISQKLRLAIKSKLTTLDAYIDDEVGFQGPLRKRHVTQ